MQVHDRFEAAVNLGAHAVGGWVWEIVLVLPEVEEVAKGEACQQGTEKAGEEDQLTDAPLVWQFRDLFVAYIFFKK